eukprot:11471391-Karenia_brevis.AAC.2
MAEPGTANANDTCPDCHVMLRTASASDYQGPALSPSALHYQGATTPTTGTYDGPPTGHGGTLGSIRVDAGTG